MRCRFFVCSKPFAYSADVAPFATLNKMCYILIKGAHGGFMLTLNVRQMRASIGHLDELISREGEILIVRHGDPIARVVSIRAKRQRRPSHADLRKKMPKQRVSAARLIRQERDDRN